MAAIVAFEPGRGYHGLIERVITYTDEQLEWSLSLSPEDRLRQADAASRLYLALHQPFATPEAIGFDTIEEYFEYDREHCP